MGMERMASEHTRSHNRSRAKVTQRARVADAKRRETFVTFCALLCGTNCYLSAGEVSAYFSTWSHITGALAAGAAFILRAYYCYQVSLSFFFHSPLIVGARLAFNEKTAHRSPASSTRCSRNVHSSRALDTCTAVR